MYSPFLQATSEKRVTIGQEIASGIEYMHSRNPVIIHQDLKPLNIMVKIMIINAVCMPCTVTFKLIEDYHGVYNITHMCDITTDMLYRNIAECYNITHVSGSAHLWYRSQETSVRFIFATWGSPSWRKPHRQHSQQCQKVQLVLSLTWLQKCFHHAEEELLLTFIQFWCLLIELFGQKRLWQGLSGPQIMRMVCGTFSSAPTGPSTQHLKEPICVICDHCTQLEASNRPPIGDVMTMIKSLSGD